MKTKQIVKRKNIQSQINASAYEITKAFKSKTRIMHPSKGGIKPEESFDDLTEAYTVLSDEKKENLR